VKEYGHSVDISYEDRWYLILVSSKRKLDGTASTVVLKQLFIAFALSLFAI